MQVFCFSKLTGLVLGTSCLLKNSSVFLSVIVMLMDMFMVTRERAAETKSSQLQAWENSTFDVNMRTVTSKAERRLQVSHNQEKAVIDGVIR